MTSLTPYSDQNTDPADRREHFWAADAAPPPGLPVDAGLAAFIAAQAIDLFTETRDVHARDEDEAKRQAVRTVAEGASLDVKALAVEPADGPRAVTVKATTLRWVLDGILSFAANDPEIPVLSAVRLRTREDGQLTATATDRYRVGIVRLPADSITDRVGEIDALIPRAAAEALLGLLLPEPDDRDEGDTSWLTEARITQTGDRVDVKLTCSKNYLEPSYGFLTVDGPPYPPVEGIIRRIADQSPNLTQPAAFTPRLLEGFDKLDHYTGIGEGVRFWCGADPNTGVAVAIGSHFIGAVMPLRQQDKDRRMDPWPTLDVDVWAPILGDPAPRKETKQ